MGNNLVPISVVVDPSLYSLVELDSCNSILGRFCDFIFTALKINPLMLNGESCLTMDASHLEYLFDIINEGRPQEQILYYEIYRVNNETNVNLEFISFDKIVLSFDYKGTNYYFIFDDRFQALHDFSKEYMSLKITARTPEQARLYNVFPCVLQISIHDSEDNNADTSS